VEHHLNQNLYLPNYKDGSIVNLMSSILRAYNCESDYEPLQILNPDELRAPTNFVLMVIDGLGYEYLLEHGKGSVFNRHLKGRVTSVFPATTASGITTFLTGVAPQQHAITGWFMYLKEMGLVAKILPFMPRSGGLSFSLTDVDPKIIFNQESIFDRIGVDSYYVIYKELLTTDYTSATSNTAKGIGYQTLADFFTKIKETIALNNNKKYIYAYWPEFDGLCHHYGTNSPEVFSHFKELERSLRSFLETIKGTNTMMLITSDHGFINTEESRIINLKEHPQFADTLTLPLCGEPRVAYCYVRPSRVNDFKKYVRRIFKDICEVHRGEELIENNYFGLFEPHTKLFDRVGDYVLIMKENYVMKDVVAGEREHHHIGNHGGVSKEEMFVPLIVIKVK